MKVKNIILTTLLACTLCMSVEAMKRKHEDNGNEHRDNKRICSSQEGEYNYSLENLPTELKQEILKKINQQLPKPNHPTFVMSCLKAFKSLQSFIRADKECYNNALEHIKNNIIKPLLNFDDEQNINLNPRSIRDLVAACFAFKILTGIRRCPISSSFCNVQYRQVYVFLRDHGIITQEEIERGEWPHCEGADLLNAVRRKDLKALVRAIAGGANVNAQMRQNHSMFNHMSALQFATIKGYLNIACTLTVTGANICTTVNNPNHNFHGWTILHLACYEGDYQRDRNNELIIPIFLATIQDHEQRTNFVNATINNPRCNYHGFTALHLAAHSGYDKTLDTLLKSRADVNAVVDNPESYHHNWTALHLAVHGRRNITAVRNLIAAVPLEQRAAFVNATINNPGHHNHDRTALQIATQKNNPHAAQALINAGAHVPEYLMLQLQGMGVNITMENMWNQ